MSPPVVAVWVFVVELLLVFVEAALFRRTPRLGLVVGFDAFVRYALRAFWWTLPCFVLVSLRFVPTPIKAVAPFLTIGLYVAYATTLVDLFHVRQVRRALLAGDRNLAARRAEDAGRVFAKNESDAMGARLTAVLAHQLGAGRMTDLGEKLLARYEETALPRAYAWFVRLELASFRAELGRYDLARRALDACTGPMPDPRFEGERELLLARVDASDGQPDRALAVAEGKKGARWEVVRAHALAAAGRAGDAREALEAVRASDGVEALRNVAVGRGPASALAAQLLGEEATPYRG